MSVLPTALRTARQSFARRSATRAVLPSSRITAHPITIPARAASSLPVRNTGFTSPTAEHIKHIRTLLSSSNSLLTSLDDSSSQDDLEAYNTDWMNKYKGQSRVVVKPKTTEEVSQVMKYCYEQGIAVVPQGGNTGLVGKYQSIRRGISEIHQYRNHHERSP